MDERSTPIRLTFGELEGRLARMHDIAIEKRTQFQARLRNFQKLGLPEDVGGGRGKTVYYGVGHAVELALAVELTQLGLVPERVISVFRQNKFPIFMAVRMAAQAIIEKGGFLPDSERSRSGENMPTNTGHWWVSHDEADDPMSMFLYFDPSALASLMPGDGDDEDIASATFFYGGPGIIRENIVRWTAGPHVRRLSLINVTAMLWSLVNRTKAETQKQFMLEVVEWADAVEEAHFVETVTDGMSPENTVIIKSYEDVVRHADLMRQLKGLPPSVAEAMIKVAKRKLEEGAGHEEADVTEAVQELRGLQDGDG